MTISQRNFEAGQLDFVTAEVSLNPLKRPNPFSPHRTYAPGAPGARRADVGYLADGARTANELKMRVADLRGPLLARDELVEVQQRAGHALPDGLGFRTECPLVVDQLLKNGKLGIGRRARQTEFVTQP